MLSRSPDNVSTNAEIFRTFPSAEAHDDQKNLDRSIKELSAAEKTHNRSIKAAVMSQRAVDYAVENEYETAKALNRATHNHDIAITNGENAREADKLNRQYEAHLQQGVDAKGRHFAEMQQRKTHNDHVREAELSEIDAHAAFTVAADAHSTSLDNSQDTPVDAAAPAGSERGATGAATGDGDWVASAYSMLSDASRSR